VHPCTRRWTPGGQRRPYRSLSIPPLCQAVHSARLFIAACVAGLMSELTDFSLHAMMGATFSGATRWSKEPWPKLRAVSRSQPRGWGALCSCLVPGATSILAFITLPIPRCWAGGPRQGGVLSSRCHKSQEVTRAWNHRCHAFFVAQSIVQEVCRALSRRSWCDNCRDQFSSQDSGSHPPVVGTNGRGQRRRDR
jgi:hypothetical protein